MSLKEPIQDSDLLSELSSKKIPWKEKQLTLKDVQMVSRRFLRMSTFLYEKWNQVLHVRWHITGTVQHKGFIRNDVIFPDCKRSLL